MSKAVKPAFAVIAACGIATVAYLKGPLSRRESNVNPATSSGAQAQSRNRAPASLARSSPVATADALRKCSDRLKELKACLESNACDFPKDDPRSYSFAIAHDISERPKAATASSRQR